MAKKREEINKGVLLFVLISGCFLSVLNQTLINVALSDLMVVFNVSATTIQWLSTGFMLVNGVLIPTTAFLMKRFSTRQLFIGAMFLLLFGTIICAIAPSFSFLLAGRMIQAAGAGVITPLMMSVILSIFPPEKRGGAMGLIGFALIFAPAIGPTLSGFVVEYVSWRWLFICRFQSFCNYFVCFTIQWKDRINSFIRKDTWTLYPKLVYFASIDRIFRYMASHSHCRIIMFTCNSILFLSLSSKI